MKLNNPGADLFIPDGMEMPGALARTTHFGVGAHQDDLEFMAFHGIESCFGQKEQRFTGITCTNGAGSPRAGIYANFSDEEMRRVRVVEQRTAATIGKYAAMVQLDYSSSVVKDPGSPHLKSDLARIFSAARPKAVYTHNLADKHDTHVAVAITVIHALRALPPSDRPAIVYGCEVWRDLDWLPDKDKVLLNVSGRENLAAALSGVFDSQISGGKRYDLAVVGRRRANATFFESHGTDQAAQLTFAMNLAPLVANDSLDLSDYVVSFIDQFKADVVQRLRALCPKR
jgi:LmbE family N-acetylglucosaminyl deacetylase